MFQPAGEELAPTDLARGPWDAGAQHGGAPAALIARALERCDGAAGFHIARLGVEFVRPVPLSPLLVETEVVRPGRRVQLVAATVLAEGVEVCRASALRIRRTPSPIVAATAPEPPPPGPEAGRDAPAPMSGLERSFVGEAMEKRFVSGDYALGPAIVWMRLRHPLVAGEEPSPLQRVAATADFGNGVSAELDWDDNVFINPDLTLHLEREAEGEWICLEARTRLQSTGTGTAESVLHDRRGRVGRAVQSLYVARRS
ncbi:MAG: hypothetical protein QOK31_231 [Solirubrobacteraceae bacterium]|nr:hypothetical protein [Solirubrobacteraceae bacterium]